MKLIKKLIFLYLFIFIDLLFIIKHIYTNILNFFFRVKVTFIRASGERIEAKGKVGDTLLDIVVNNDIDLDGFGKYAVLRSLVFELL